MPEPSIPFVILMGVGVVFIGLICIILLCMAMSAICRSMGDKTPAPAPLPPPPLPPGTSPTARPWSRRLPSPSRRKWGPIPPVSVSCPLNNFN